MMGYSYETLPEKLRVQIVHIWREIVAGFGGVFFRGPDVVMAPIRQTLCREFGVFTLAKEKAILTATRHVGDWRWKAVRVEEAKFKNGHWEVWLSSAPPRPGDKARFDVSDQGELLWVQTTY